MAFLFFFFFFFFSKMAALTVVLSFVDLNLNVNGQESRCGSSSFSGSIPLDGACKVSLHGVLFKTFKSLPLKRLLIMVITT